MWIKVDKTRSKVDSTGRVFTVYCVQVRRSSGEGWIVERRYSQFELLHRSLLEAFPELGIEGFGFPVKTWFSSGT